MSRSVVMPVLSRSITPFRRRPRPLAHIYAEHFHGTRRERHFLASISFFVSFGIVRLITHAIRRKIGPFRNIGVGQVHLHHLVLGIALLLTDGYLWLGQLGTGDGRGSRWGSRLTALAFGIGSALTLDEFALWLNLSDVYWARQGRESIDAVALWGAVLSASFWGRYFLRGLWRELTLPFR